MYSRSGPGSDPDLGLAQLLLGLLRHTLYLMVSGTACGIIVGLAMRWVFFADLAGVFLEGGYLCKRERERGGGRHSALIGPLLTILSHICSTQ